MKILVLGGTIFLGRHFVEAALARGHEVTLFNRGQHHPELFPEVEKIRGNRDGGLSALEGRQWDAVFDPSGYFPRLVRDAAQQLTDSVERYVFISSLSAYANLSQPGSTEDSALATLSDPTVETVTGETYGGLKVLCEQAAEEVMPGRILIPRPGYIVGPHDPSDRFTYWVRRSSQGGTMLAPGSPNAPFQIIDVRDLTEWIVRLMENKQTGIYNATGPDYPLTFGKVLEESIKVSGADTKLKWVSEESLLKAGELDLPLWAPSSGDYAGVHTVKIDKALAAGLTFRPLTETIKATLDWDSSLSDSERVRKAGLSPEQEQNLLQQLG